MFITITAFATHERHASQQLQIDYNMTLMTNDKGAARLVRKMSY